MSSDELITTVTEPPSRGSGENIIVRSASEEAAGQGDHASTMTQEVSAVKKKRVSKEIYTITKLMISASVAVILVNAQLEEFKSWVDCVETSTQLVALVFMLCGIYVRVEWPIVSKWLQVVGHFICVTCLMILHTPLLRLLPHAAFVWDVVVIPLLLLLALLLLVFYHCCLQKMKMKMMLIVLKPSWLTATPIARQPISGESSASQGVVEDV